MNGYIVRIECEIFGETKWLYADLNSNHLWDRTCHHPVVADKYAATKQADWHKEKNQGKAG